MSMTAASDMIRLSADDFPEKQRVEAVREIYGKSIIKVELEPLGSTPFRFDAKLHALSGLKFASGTLSPVRGLLTKELIGSDDLLFNVTLSGGRTLQQCGREAPLGPGEGGLTTSVDPGVVTVHSPSQFISFRTPRRTLQRAIGDLDAALVRTIPSDNEALRLLIGYARLINESQAMAKPAMRSLVAIHFQDLIALALGGTRESVEIARGRGVPAARLGAIKSDILANLASADLTIDAIAKRHGITQRYIGMLFAADQTSFTQFVLMGRLEAAYRMLRNPLYRDRPIGEVALSCGFGDLSYFNRVFRRRYGATPSDVREAARNAPENGDEP
jgi:AraC-like DNA-binding protein